MIFCLRIAEVRSYLKTRTTPCVNLSLDKKRFFKVISLSDTENKFTDLVQLREVYPFDGNEDVFLYLNTVKTDWLEWYETSILGTHGLNVRYERSKIKDGITKSLTHDDDIKHFHERVHEALAWGVISLRKKYRKFIQQVIHSLLYQLLPLITNKNDCVSHEQLLTMLRSRRLDKAPVRTLPENQADANTMLKELKNDVNGSAEKENEEDERTVAENSRPPGKKQKTKSSSNPKNISKIRGKRTKQIIKAAQEREKLLNEGGGAIAESMMCQSSVRFNNSIQSNSQSRLVYLMT